MYALFLFAMACLVVIIPFAIIAALMRPRRPARRQRGRDRYDRTSSRDDGGSAYIGDSGSSADNGGMNAGGGDFGGGGASGSWGDSGGDSGGGGDGGGGGD